MRRIKFTPVVLALVVIYLCVPHARRAWAAFNAPPQVWSSTYELDPTSTDPVSQGDDHLRGMKNEVRRRLNVEHDWSTVSAGFFDTGRHLSGSARAFSQNTAPSVDGTSGALCINGVVDTLGGRACDSGRLWVDKDGLDGVAANGDDNALYACDDTDADGDCDAWDAVTVTAGVPTGALILWDQSNTCPTGYAEEVLFRDQAIRGADRNAGNSYIPDDAGVNCNGAILGAGCGGPAGAANYNDVIETAELPAHSHTFTATNQLLAGGGVGLSTINGAGTASTSNTGSGQISYPPIRTVIFCRKS